LLAVLSVQGWLEEEGDTEEVGEWVRLRGTILDMMSNVLIAMTLLLIMWLIRIGHRSLDSGAGLVRSRRLLSVENVGLVEVKRND
jgi:hypothetical protein